MCTTTISGMWNAALDEVVEELLASVEITAPPVDAFQLAERLKVVVVFDAFQRVRGRHKKVAGRASIFLRPDARPERLQWTVAHELGEVVAWRVFDRLVLPDDEIPLGLRENVANLLAPRLLLPSQWFFDDARRLYGDVLQLKPLYRTASHEVIANRLLDLLEPSILTIFDHGRITRRRTNLAGKPPRLQPVERDCWEEVHRRNCPSEMHENGLCVQGWPIHEEGWKRELLRTTTTWEYDGTELYF